jgi:phosphoglycerate dehydrogenase-like enzyme
VTQAFSIMHPDGDEILRAYADLHTFSNLDPDTVVRESQGAVAIIGRTPLKVDGAMLDAMPTVRVLTATGSGVDCFDVGAASARGIPVLHNPGVGATPIVEYALGAMVAIAKRFRERDLAVRNGTPWEPKSDFMALEVTGKTLGVVGLGHIGSEVARRARAAFDMRVLGHDPVVPDERFAELGVEPRTLPDLLTEADIVTLHVPLMPATRHLISSTELRTMRPGSILVNASRGGVVDEAALVAALEDGHLYGAAVDVFETEPAPTDHPLTKFPNVLVSPHVAGMSVEANRKLAVAVARNLVDALEGRRPPHIADPVAWPPARWAGRRTAGATTP